MKADATTALVYFKKAAEGFQVLAEDNPSKYADAYAMAEKWASGTGFNVGDLTDALVLNNLCSDK